MMDEFGAFPEPPEAFQDALGDERGATIYSMEGTAGHPLDKEHWEACVDCYFESTLDTESLRWAEADPAYYEELLDAKETARAEEADRQAAYREAPPLDDFDF